MFVRASTRVSRPLGSANQRAVGVVAKGVPSTSTAASGRICASTRAVSHRPSRNVWLHSVLPLTTAHISPNGDLTARLMALVIDRLGKPLKPKAIEFVRDLPKTRNAKVMRRVIRATYLGDAPGDLSSLENPQAVADIRAVASSRTQ